MAVKARHLPYHVVGVEKDAATWGDALAVGAVDEITNDLAAGVAGADLVILAVPVAAILKLLPQLPAIVGEKTVVTDTGSVKSAIAAVGFAVLGARFVPGHPMAGSERGGVLAARADLFRGATWAITTEPGKDNGVSAFVQSLGATPHLLTPTAHDETVALTSHLPHVLAYALCNVATARHSTATPTLSAGSWRDVTRVAESSPELWAGIAAQNAAPLAQALRRVIAELDTAATALETGDAETVRDRFAAGHAAKVER